MIKNSGFIITQKKISDYSMTVAFLLGKKGKTNESGTS